MRAQPQVLAMPCAGCGELLTLEPLIVLDDTHVFWFDCEDCRLVGPAVVPYDE